MVPIKLNQSRRDMQSSPEIDQSTKMMQKSCDPVKIDTDNIKQILKSDVQWRELKDNLRKGGYSTNLSIKEALHHQVKNNKESKNDVKLPKMRSRDSSSSLADITEALISGAACSEKENKRALGRRLWMVPQDSSSSLASTKCIYAEVNNSFSTLTSTSEDKSKSEDNERRFDILVKNLEDSKKPTEHKSLGDLLNRTSRKLSLDARMKEEKKDVVSSEERGLSRLFRRMSLATDLPRAEHESKHAPDTSTVTYNDTKFGELLETWNHELRTEKTHIRIELDQDSVAVMKEDTEGLLEDWDHDLRARMNR